ncbi:MAG TPA: hypothetical protein VFJ09_05395 [Nocardioidaceae bacterium]|nr:hypothetical protein [Nocardioidaceae bacterium]
MNPEQMRRAHQGLAAWQRGDVSELADLMDPQAELHWWTPGAWDCHGKQEVLALLSARARLGSPVDAHISELGGTTLLVTRRDRVERGPEAGYRPATLVRFQGDRLMSMQQYRCREDALADADGPAPMPHQRRRDDR